MSNANNTNLKRENIIQIINDFLQDEFEVDKAKLNPEADIRETLELDSLDYIDLVVVMEKNLHIKVDPADLSDMRTIQNLYDYVLLNMEQSNNKLF